MSEEEIIIKFNEDIEDIKISLRIKKCPICYKYFIPHSKQVYCDTCQKLNDDIKIQNPFQKTFRYYSKRARQRKRLEDKSKVTKFLDKGMDLRDKYKEEYKNKIPSGDVIVEIKDQIIKSFESGEMIGGTYENKTRKNGKHCRECGRDE